MNVRRPLSETRTPKPGRSGSSSYMTPASAGLRSEQQSIRQALLARLGALYFLRFHQEIPYWQRLGNTYHALACAAMLSYAQGKRVISMRLRRRLFPVRVDAL